MFNPQRCYLEIWCGKHPKPDNYKKIGTPYECLRLGFGAGKNNDIAYDSLKKIPYITPEREDFLETLGVFNLMDFLNHVNSFINYRHTKAFLNNLHLTNAQFNKIVLYLYKSGIPIFKLPACKR